MFIIQAMISLAHLKKWMSTEFEVNVKSSLKLHHLKLGEVYTQSVAEYLAYFVATDTLWIFYVSIS